MSTSTSTLKSKYFKEGDLITNLEKLAASQGYISAKKIHSKNIIMEDKEDQEDEDENKSKSKGENISDFLSNGDYYVPSYLTLFKDDHDDDHNNDEDDHKVIENISITITPIEKCNPIDDELYNKLVESAELQGTSNSKKSTSSNKSNIKNKKTKKVLNKNKKSKVGGGKKTKRKN